MRNFVLTSVLLLASLLVSALVLEIGARIAVGSPWSERLPLVRVRPDPDLGWTMVPGDEHYTYHHKVKLNQLGFRGPEVSKKRANEYRVLVIGDSHVYGQGLADSELVTTYLQADLNGVESVCTFRVINMGVRAYSTNQQLVLLEKTGLALKPDHVFLFFYINDFIPVNIPHRYQRFKEFDWYSFDLSGKPDGATLQSWKRLQVLRKSSFLMWANDQLNAWRYRDNIEGMVLTGADDVKVDHSVAAVQEYLQQFATLLREKNISFTLVVVPVATQIVRAYPTNKYQSVLNGFSKHWNIDYIDLLPALRKYYRNEHRIPIIPFDGHYDRDGHRIMAAYVGEHVRGLAPTCDRAIPQ